MRLCLVHIQAIMPGTHSGDHAWYTFRRLRVVHISTVNDKILEKTPQSLRARR
jgi:hypothetical protein